MKSTTKSRKRFLSRNHFINQGPSRIQLLLQDIVNLNIEIEKLKSERNPEIVIENEEKNKLLILQFRTKLNACENEIEKLNYKILHLREQLGIKDERIEDEKGRYHNFVSDIMQLFFPENGKESHHGGEIYDKETLINMIKISIEEKYKELNDLHIAKLSADLVEIEKLNKEIVRISKLLITRDETIETEKRKYQELNKKYIKLLYPKNIKEIQQHRETYEINRILIKDIFKWTK